MQVNDTVKVAKARDDDQEAIGRAGRVIRIEKNPADQDDAICYVELDETATHEAGVDTYLESQLEFLGR
jgi:hypothetical protein